MGSRQGIVIEVNKREVWSGHFSLLGDVDSEETKRNMIMIIMNIIIILILMDVFQSYLSYFFQQGLTLSAKFAAYLQ